MAISIKNHEDRITVLEKVSNTRLSVNVVWTGSSTTTVTIPDINQYSLVLFISQGNGFNGYDSLMIPISYFKSIKSFTHYPAYDRQAGITYVSDTQIRVSTVWEGFPKLLALIK